MSNGDSTDTQLSINDLFLNEVSFRNRMQEMQLGVYARACGLPVPPATPLRVINVYPQPPAASSGSPPSPGAPSAAGGLLKTALLAGGLLTGGAGLAGLGALGHSLLTTPAASAVTSPSIPQQQFDVQFETVDAEGNPVTIKPGS